MKASDGRALSKHLWTRLADDLNAAGPPTREVDGWKKVCALVLNSYNRIN